MEQQNQLLRRQLSISQNQLIQAWGGDREEGAERGGEGTGNKATPRCKDKVSNFRIFIFFYLEIVLSILFLILKEASWCYAKIYSYHGVASSLSLLWHASEINLTFVWLLRFSGTETILFSVLS